MSGAARLRVGLLAAVLMAGCGSPAVAVRSPQVSTPGSQRAPSPSLPPCLTATATACDKSNIHVGGNGSSGCKGSGTGTITASPIALEDIAFIEPMGLMAGGHVTPIDHGYFYVKGALASPPVQAAVYSPMDGNISTVTRSVRGAGNSGYDDYAITIEATCTFRVRFSNLVRFAGPLGSTIGQLQGNETKNPNYAVKAGELIGYTGLPTAYGIDVWVENDDLSLSGFINPAQYTAAETWKTHMADLFDYTREPLKSQLLALLERDASPRWGKIDYDIDGRLVGNWFLAGSGGYRGLHPMVEGYWVGHLAIVYDGNDPGQVDMSFGNYQGVAQQFAVVGSTPDPATVAQSSGLVKYELGQIQSYSATTGAEWDAKTYLPHMRVRAAGGVLGTVLVQLVGERSLKVEIFPGKSAAAVTGFDSSALLYER
jgi:hypothetical protein